MARTLALRSVVARRARAGSDPVEAQRVLPQQRARRFGAAFGREPGKRLEDVVVRRADLVHREVRGAETALHSEHVQRVPYERAEAFGQLVGARRRAARVEAEAE